MYCIESISQEVLFKVYYIKIEQKLIKLQLKRCTKYINLSRNNIKYILQALYYSTIKYKAVER